MTLLLITHHHIIVGIPRPLEDLYLLRPLLYACTVVRTYRHNIEYR